MKKFSKMLAVVLALLLIVPISAGDMKFKLFLNGGYTMISNGDFNDMIEGMSQATADLYTYFGYDNVVVTGDQITGFIGPNVEIGAEISDFLVALKIGIPGTVTSVFNTQMDTASGAVVIENEMELKNWAFPLGLNVYYKMNLSDAMNLYLGLGFEYYMSKITNEETINTVNGTDLGLSDPEEFKGSGIAGLVNVKGEYALSEMFSLFLGVTGRLGKISGYEGQGDINGTTMYSFDTADYHLWDNLTPEEKEAYEADPDISNFQEAEINMTGFEIYFGVGINF